MLKNDFYEISTSCSAETNSKIKNAQDLLKFGTFDIWNISIFMLMPQIIFIKYLPRLQLKLVPKLKMLKIY